MARELHEVMHREVRPFYEKACIAVPVVCRAAVPYTALIFPGHYRHEAGQLTGGSTLSDGPAVKHTSRDLSRVIGAVHDLQTLRRACFVRLHGPFGVKRVAGDYKVD